MLTSAEVRYDLGSVGPWQRHLILLFLEGTKFGFSLGAGFISEPCFDTSNMSNPGAEDSLRAHAAQIPGRVLSAAETV